MTMAYAPRVSGIPGYLHPVFTTMKAIPGTVNSK